MYKAFRKAGVSLLAIAALILLFAPSVMAREWGKGAAGDIVGMDVTARHGGVVGKVNDVSTLPDGRIQEVIIGLNGTDSEVAVPMSSIRVHRDHVAYEGTREDLYSMAPTDTQRGYYGDEGSSHSDRGRYHQKGGWHGYNLNPMNPDLPTM